MIKIFNKVINIIYIIIIIILLGYFILRLSNKIEIFNVETGSMEDNIHRGDYILIFKQHNYHVGDIITFKVKDYFITHRITKIDNDMITTKGDANNTEDDIISKDNIIGKVIIAGGILNTIINYKYAIAGILLVLYLFSCYFNSNNKNNTKDIKNEDNLNKKIKENN